MNLAADGYRFQLPFMLVPSAEGKPFALCPGAFCPFWSLFYDEI